MLELLQVARLHDPLVAGVVIVVRRATSLVLPLPLLLVHLLAEDGGTVVAVGTVVLHGLWLAGADRRLVLLHEVAVLLGAERGPAVDVARLVALLLLDLVARLDSAVLRERVARPDSHDRGRRLLDVHVVPELRRSRALLLERGRDRLSAGRDRRLMVLGRRLVGDAPRATRVMRVDLAALVHLIVVA